MKDTKNLATALIKAMQKVSYLQKDTTIGDEKKKSSYRGISDEKATKAIRDALIENNIACLQIEVNEEVELKRWIEEGERYNKWSKQNEKYSTAKVQAFVKCKSTFMLIHSESGESITIQGTGHAVDSGDKGAGKAMTYAKKNALLNSLLISTGLDSDDTHNEDLPKPPVQEAKAQAQPQQEPKTKSNKGNTQLQQAIKEAIKIATEEQKTLVSRLLSSSVFTKEERHAFVNDLNSSTTPQYTSDVIDEIQQQLNNNNRKKNG